MQKFLVYKVDEGSSYGLYKGSGKPSGAMKKYLDNAKKMQCRLRKRKNQTILGGKNNPDDPITSFKS